MDKSLRIEFKVTKGDHDYIFSIPYGSPLGAAYDAAHEMLSEIVVMAQAETKNAKQDQGEPSEEVGESDGSK